MKNRFIGLLVAMCLLIFGFSTANADKPLDVDCDVLESTLTNVDAFLDGEGVNFPNLGQLVSQSKKDPVLFSNLSGLVLLFSGGAIDFTGPRQVVPTVAKCGLLPHLLAEIAD